MTEENNNTPLSITLTGNELPVNKLSRTEFLQQISETLDDYSAIEYTPEEKTQIAKHLRKVAHGASALGPMICAGEACPVADRCPLIAMSKPPIGLSCPIEANLLQYWRLKYMEEYNIDPNSLTEVGFVSTLAEIEMYLTRINQQLARPENAMLISRQTIGITPQGREITQVQESAYLGIRDKMLNRKEKIIKLLVGDRQEKYKREAALKKRETADPSSTMADLRKTLTTIQQKSLEEGE